MRDIPVYFFEGFLEGGKTTYIQRIIDDNNFPPDMNLLVIMCEDGMEQINTYGRSNITVEYIDDIEKVSSTRLRSMEKRTGCNTVIVEYNGMWMTGDFINRMPKNWIGVRKFVIADAGSFLTYNSNMRALVADKLKECTAAVFNRVDDTTDRLALHRLVRSFSRLTDIFFELTDGTELADDIPDELPFDINADIIEIEDRDYAEWERDISDEPEKYEGKIVRLHGFAVKGSDSRQGHFEFGRQVMTCCEDDITFLAFPVVCTPESEPKSGSWLELTAMVQLQQASNGQPCPVLMLITADKLPVPANTLATFY